MDASLTILDKNLIKTFTIDTYKSLIWTERYNQYGDFEVQIPIDESSFSKKLLETNEAGETIWMDCYASIQGSDNLMFLEQFRITDNPENDGKLLVITGRSLESILMRRIIWGLKILNDTLQNGIQSLLNDAIISPSDENRRIDNFTFLASIDPAITSLNLVAQYTGDNLYDVITSICSKNKLGFKVVFDDQSGNFVFSLYAGKDHSYDQDVNPYVIFSYKYENLLNSDYLESNGFYKNVVLVAGEGNGSIKKYVSVGEASGLDRREMFTDAGSIRSNSSGFTILQSKPSDWETNWTSYYINTGDSDNPNYEQLIGSSAPTWMTNTFYKYDQDVIVPESEYEEMLTQRGQKDLDENIPIKSFNGEIDPFTMYKYGVDFSIGDIVQISDGYGKTAKCRVSELIRSFDDSGFTVYPTFYTIKEDENDNN